MSLYKSRTLCICKTKCYKCGEEYNAAYIKAEYNDSLGMDKNTTILSPESFTTPEKEIAQENDVIIETREYGFTNYPNFFTVNVCPHCGAPFGNGYIKELKGKEIKKIKIR